MTCSNRRIFLARLLAGGSALAATTAQAQALPLVAESDAQATAMGYKADTTKVDAKKYPKHDNAQKCSNCQLFQGKPGEAQAGCPIFAGKAVTANGWCSAWVKKAG